MIVESALTMRLASSGLPGTDKECHVQIMNWISSLGRRSNDGAVAVPPPPLAQEIRELRNDPRALFDLGQRRHAEVRCLLNEARGSLPAGASHARIYAFAASLISVQSAQFEALCGGRQGLPAYSSELLPGESSIPVNPGAPPAYSERQELHFSESALVGNPATLPEYSEHLPEGHTVLEAHMVTPL